MDLFAEEEEEAQSKASAGDHGGEGAGDTEVEQKKESQLDLEGEKDAQRNSPALMPMANPSASTQLTIFYNGTISVFEGVLPEKAQAIMLIAAATAAVAKVAANYTPSAAFPTTVKAPVTANAAATDAVGVLGTTPMLTRSLSFQSSSAATLGGQPHLVLNSSSLCKLHAELPLARRHSLQRFLEKRRDRLVSKAPYASAKPPDRAEVASKGEPSARVGYVGTLPTNSCDIVELPLVYQRM